LWREWHDGGTAVAGSSSAGAPRNGDHSDRADVRFARANIQIYDARMVDLYQWVCARYLVGVKGAETKAKRSQARLSTEFQKGLRWLSKPCPAQKQSGGQPSKYDNLLYISIGYGGESVSQLPLKDFKTALAVLFTSYLRFPPVTGFIYRTPRSTVPG
jgi:hypothetical protein